MLALRPQAQAVCRAVKYMPKKTTVSSFIAKRYYAKHVDVPLKADNPSFVLHGIEQTSFDQVSIHALIVSCRFCISYDTPCSVQYPRSRMIRSWFRSPKQEYAAVIYIICSMAVSVNSRSESPCASDTNPAVSLQS